MIDRRREFLPRVSSRLESWRRVIVIELPGTTIGGRLLETANLSILRTSPETFFLDIVYGHGSL